MRVDKINVSFEGELGDAVRSSAQRAGVDLSVWLATAATAQLRAEALADFRDEWGLSQSPRAAALIARADVGAGVGAGVERGVEVASGRLGELAGLDVPAAGGVDGVEHPAVVGDQQQRAGVVGERGLELLDGGQVEVVGRLVEHQQVHAARLQQRQAGAGALAGRQGRAPGATWSDRSPNLASSVRTSAVSTIRQQPAEGVEQRLVAVEQRAGLVDLADHDARAERAGAGIERQPAEQRRQQGGLAGAVGAGDATRSAQSSWRSTGPSVKARRRTTASLSAATTEPDRGAAAICIRSSHSLRGSSTTSRRSIMRCVWRALAACFSVVSARLFRPILSLSLALRRALRTPLSIQLRCIRARAFRSSTRFVVLLVGLAGVPAGDLALVEVGLVAAAVEAHLLLGKVQLERHR